MRALSFKQKGRDADAHTLFRELLETRVLNEVGRELVTGMDGRREPVVVSLQISFDDKDDKLFSIRYNCHKNLALIYEDKGEEEKALEHFMEVKWVISGIEGSAEGFFKKYNFNGFPKKNEIKKLRKFASNNYLQLTKPVISVSIR